MCNADEIDRVNRSPREAPDDTQSAIPAMRPQTQITVGLSGRGRVGPSPGERNRFMGGDVVGGVPGSNLFNLLEKNGHMKTIVVRPENPAAEISTSLGIQR